MVSVSQSDREQAPRRLANSSPTATDVSAQDQTSWPDSSTGMRYQAGALADPRACSGALREIKAPALDASRFPVVDRVSRAVAAIYILCAGQSCARAPELVAVGWPVAYAFNGTAYDVCDEKNNLNASDSHFTRASMSHIAIIQDARARGYASIEVIEDDTVFLEEDAWLLEANLPLASADALAALIATPENTWATLRLGWRYIPEHNSSRCEGCRCEVQRRAENALWCVVHKRHPPCHLKSSHHYVVSARGYDAILAPSALKMNTRSHIDRHWANFEQAIVVPPLSTQFKKQKSFAQGAAVFREACVTNATATAAPGPAA